MQFIGFVSNNTLQIIHKPFDILRENEVKHVRFQREQNKEFQAMVNGLIKHATKKNQDIIKHRFVKDISFKHIPAAVLTDKEETTREEFIRRNEGLISVDDANARLDREKQKIEKQLHMMRAENITMQKQQDNLIKTIRNLQNDLSINQLRLQAFESPPSKSAISSPDPSMSPEGKIRNISTNFIQTSNFSAGLALQKSHEKHEESKQEVESETDVIMEKDVNAKRKRDLSLPGELGTRSNKFPKVDDDLENENDPYGGFEVDEGNRQNEGGSQGL